MLARTRCFTHIRAITRNWSYVHPPPLDNFSRFAHHRCHMLVCDIDTREHKHSIGT